MKIFTYSAVDPEGISQSGTIKAVSKQQAVNSLRVRKLFITDLKEKHQIKLSDLFYKLRGVPALEKILFTRQLGTMIGAGLPINQALGILAEQAGSAYFREIIQDVVQEVDGGSSLYKALSKYEKVFGRLYVSLIKAGESSGNLETILYRLADTMEAEASFKGKVKGAMIYPVIIVIVMVLVMVVMFIFVIPRLAELYEDLDAELPLMTRILIGFSEMLISYGWLVLIVLGALFFLMRKILKNQDIARKVGRTQMRLPVFGALGVEVQLTSFTRTLAMLLSSGIPLLEAIDISKETLGNVIFRDAAEGIAAMVEKGKPMSDAFKKVQTFPPLVNEMLAVGEQTGKVEEILNKLSSYFQAQASRKTENLTSAIEPIVMVVLGVMVGFLVVSLILPIYSLTSQF